MVSQIDFMQLITLLALPEMTKNTNELQQTIIPQLKISFTDRLQKKSKMSLDIGNAFVLRQTKALYVYVSKSFVSKKTKNKKFYTIT